MQKPPLVHRLVCGLVRSACRKSGGKRDAKPPLVNRLVRRLISLTIETGAFLRGRAVGYVVL